MALKDSGIPPNRDVIYLAADEEEAGRLEGAGWLIENHPEIFEDVGYLINEGGIGSLLNDTPALGIEVTQKYRFGFARLQPTSLDTALHRESIVP